MKVQIIGLGVVGMAQAKLVHKLNHKVYAYDIIEKNMGAEQPNVAIP